ncbi:MAG: hypothetical protein AAF533_10340 [Acidobacteriota bacterium]
MTRLVLSAALLTALSASSALAGPPLLCHPLEIGEAESLPWQEAKAWRGLADGYDTSRIAADTLKLVAAESSPVVRMETLRRAAVYCLKSRETTRDLLLGLSARAASSEPDSVARFDLAYFLAACRQGREFFEREGHEDLLELFEDFDVRGVILESARARPEQADFLLAAAVLTEMGSRSEHQRHVRRVRAAARPGTLSWRNVRARYADIR